MVLTATNPPLRGVLLILHSSSYSNPKKLSPHRGKSRSPAANWVCTATNQDPPQQTGSAPQQIEISRSKLGSHHCKSVFPATNEVRTTANRDPPRQIESAPWQIIFSRGKLGLHHCKSRYPAANVGVVRFFSTKD